VANPTRVAQVGILGGAIVIALSLLIAGLPRHDDRKSYQDAAVVPGPSQSVDDGSVSPPIWPSGVPSPDPPPSPTPFPSPSQVPPPVPSTRARLVASICLDDRWANASRVPVTVENRGDGPGTWEVVITLPSSTQVGWGSSNAVAIIVNGRTVTFTAKSGQPLAAGKSFSFFYDVVSTRSREVTDPGACTIGGQPCQHR